MSTAISTADWLDATNTFAAAADAPVFTSDSEVFYLANEPATGSNLSNTPKYVVEAVVSIPLVSGGASKLADQTLAFATPADGSTARNVGGFQHTGSISGTYGATTTSRPWFYDIRNASTGKVTRRVHQSQLTDAAGWEAYIATKLATIIA